MPSIAFRSFETLQRQATTVERASQSCASHGHAEALLASSFVLHVAAWNAYIVAIANCFLDAVSDPSHVRFTNLHTLHQAAARRRIEKFNTPNAENARQLLMEVSGYDPWSDWQWKRRRLNAMATRQRLNEILKVRHSIAHGFRMPVYDWNQTSTGRSRINRSGVQWTCAFFQHLCLTTDRSLSDFVRDNYLTTAPW